MGIKIPEYGGGLSQLYAGARTGTNAGDYTGSPILNASGTIVLPSNPSFMIVTGAYNLLSGTTVRTQGFFESLYSNGDTHVKSVFGNINWVEFENIDIQADSVSIGILTDNLSYDNAFTLEYTPATQTISILAVNTPPSNLIPVVNRLLIVGS